MTICVADRLPLFGKIVNGEMQLNAIGRVATWLVMPNHVHGIIVITNGDGGGEAYPERPDNAMGVSDFGVALSSSGDDRYASPLRIVCALTLLLLLVACAPTASNPHTPTPPSPHPPAPLRLRTPTPSRPAPPTLTLTRTATPAPLVAAPANGIPHHTLDIALNYADKRMAVEQRVVLANPGPDTWDEIVFAVPPAHQAGIFTLARAVVTTAYDQRIARTRWDGTMLRVVLPEPLAPREPVAVDLTYTIHIPPVDLETWLPQGNLGAGERLIQAGDWHPTLAPYVPGIGWRTWDYVLVGDPNIYPIADYDVTLRAGARVVIAAPGRETQAGAARRYHLERARCFAFLASPDYRLDIGKAGDVPVRVYFLPAYAEEAEAILSTAAQAIPLYEELYGPYPYAGLVVAQNAYYGAMEYSGLISMSGRAFDTYQASPVAGLVNLTAHEIAHQWWYGAVGNDQVYEPWLDESFAKYSEVLFLERYAPDFVEWWWRNHIYRRDSDGPLDATLYDFDDTPAYIDQVYAQGARFLADVRTLLGDCDFFAFVRAYRDANDGRIATRFDFFAALYDHTDADLTPLFDAYFPDLTGNRE